MDSNIYERVRKTYGPSSHCADWVSRWPILNFKRYPYGQGRRNSDGSVPGEFRVLGRTWPTIETYGPYTFVRKGIYLTTMDRKGEGEPVQCLRFDEDESIRKHLIHRAWRDVHKPGVSLEGCIAPGLTRTDNGPGIVGSAYAMEELLRMLGGFAPGRKVIVLVENNVMGVETKEEWINRRRKERGLPPRDDL